MGDLLSYLKVNGMSLSVNRTHIYAEQIANAMTYLEEKRLVHRDLAARNILVCTKEVVSINLTASSHPFNAHESCTTCIVYTHTTTLQDTKIQQSVTGQNPNKHHMV